MRVRASSIEKPSMSCLMSGVIGASLPFSSV
jgi:hypothetical protein